ncbi:hypothetical protein ACN38_g916 [Penicillium nordicum]|uniref:Uncharacterized protein n=1 Tax=Penicillium nordicum TaxID=229535 RepID=A0A0M8PCK8_9EURO|nr:hypothetical protein ACN38_g916 [Penicillium nordicum]
MFLYAHKQKMKCCMQRRKISPRGIGETKRYRLLLPQPGGILDNSIVSLLPLLYPVHRNHPFHFFIFFSLLLTASGFISYVSDLTYSDQ